VTVAESATIYLRNPAAWDNNKSAGKSASKLEGDRQLISRGEVEEDRIKSIKAVFDTRRMFAGKDS